jgi:hypothetical protein
MGVLLSCEEKQRDLDRARKPLAVLAVQKLAYRLPPGLVHFAFRFALVGAHAGLGDRVGFIVGAARRAAVCETGLIRLQLELFGADGADFDRKWHKKLMVIDAVHPEKGADRHAMPASNAQARSVFGVEVTCFLITT